MKLQIIGGKNWFLRMIHMSVYIYCLCLNVLTIDSAVKSQRYRGKIVCYNIELACWKIECIFLERVKEIFFDPQTQTLISLWRHSRMKVHSNESWINTPFTPQITFDFVGYFLNYRHLKKCHFFWHLTFSRNVLGRIDE